LYVSPIVPLCMKNSNEDLGNSVMNNTDCHRSLVSYANFDPPIRNRK
jgi:hypothetical protein